MDQFKDLTRDDLNEWAGSKIVVRGRAYQEQGRVSELAQTKDGSLIAWVDGSALYATKVKASSAGAPESICTCPYAVDCKHGVAVLLEYLESIKRKQPVPKAAGGDERLQLLAVDGKDQDAEAGENKAALSRNSHEAVDAFLNGKSKKQLIGLIREIAGQYPEIAQDLADRQQITHGGAKALIERLRREIHDIANEPGWQNYWHGEGYTPDYSGVRNKLEMLLKEGHADEVLILGQELIVAGIGQVEASDDNGETAMEVASCMPVLMKALDQSSLDSTGKLIWALEAVLYDDYEVCDAFVEYLHRQHPASSWSVMADQLIDHLHEVRKADGDHNSSGRIARGHSRAGKSKLFDGIASFGKGADDFRCNYERDRLSDWAIYALEQSGRKDEVIPFCETEAKKTGSYLRLVERLMQAQSYDEAEHWIKEGVKATSNNWPGIASNLRHKLLDIRVMEKDWPAVAAMAAEDFVRRPSRETFTDCKKAAMRVKAWPQARKCLLSYLEKGRLPWRQPDWPLPESDLETLSDIPGTDAKEHFPMLAELIDIAIWEKQPDKALKWYDELLEKRDWWFEVDEDEIAMAVESHAPDRAVAIWKKLAEQLIAKVNTSAYEEAAVYLRKAGAIMSRQKKKMQWG